MSKLTFILSVVSALSAVHAGPLDLHALRLSPIRQLESEQLNYRLPNNTLPVRYDIRLTTNIHLPPTEDEETDPKWAFTGEVDIILKPTENTRTITLHSKEQTIIQATLKENGGPTLTLKSPTGVYNETLQFLTFEVDDGQPYLLKDEEYVLSISYSAILRKDNAGFYRSSYQNEEDEIVWLATTQFESTDARHAFPCYDEPGTRAPIKLSINHHMSYNAIANMPGERKPVEGEPERINTEFEVSEPMQTYLLAFVVSDFLYTSKTVGGLTPQRLFARPQAINNFDGDFGLDSGIKILTDLENYLNTSYSLPKMDQISIPDFASGAMENWGLVTYREELLLYNPKTTSLNNKHRIATIVSHEYAHQFFGNLVSPEWWSFLWLNEGFATLYEYTTTAAVYPEFQSMDFMIRDAVQASLFTDALDTTRAMTTEVQSPTEISGLFDDIAYEKSGSVLRMIQHAISDDAFRSGLQNYVDARKFQAANSDHLAEGLQAGADEKGTAPSGVTLKALIDSWSRQEGYPVVHVERTNTGQISLAQDRFKYSTTKKEDEDQKWIIPITFATGKNPNFEQTMPKYWLIESNATIADSVVKIDAEEWIILNNQQTGFYRVKYSDSLWRLIINGLNGNSWDKIHHINRAQLVDDSLNLARGNLLDYSTTFDLLLYLKREREFLPWTSANTGFGYLNRLLLDTEPHNLFLRFVREAVYDLYKELGIQDHGLYEPLSQKVARNIAIDWACLSGEESCLSETKARVQHVLNNQDLDIEPDLRLTIFCNGLRQANITQYDAMIERLKRTDDQGVRTTLITALGCITDAAIQEKYLQSSIEEPTPEVFRKQERNRVLQAVYSQGGLSGLMSSITFVNAKHVEIDRTYSSSASTASPAASYASAMASRVTTKATQEEYTKLLTTLESATKITSAEKTGLISTTQSNIDWVAANSDDILTYFKRLYTNTAAVPVASSVVLAVVAVFTFLLNH